MESCQLLVQIREMESQLAFSRFDAHIRCAATKNIIPDITAFLASHEDSAEFKFVYKQLGIYFAFYERNKDQAAYYLEKYNLLCTVEGLEKAEALSLLGYAYLIDPTYGTQPSDKSQTIFSDAISCLSEDSQIQSNIIKAFALQYRALLLHRKAKTSKLRDIDPVAFMCIETAIDLQEKLLDTFPTIKIGLAESLHIYAIILARLGELQAREDYLEKANILFSKANLLAKNFCEESGIPHYHLAITRQSHAMLAMHFHDHPVAIKALHEVLEIQQSTSQPVIDIAKSLHYIADAYMKARQYASAVEYYLQSLICKMKIEYDRDDMIKMTENSLLAALNQLREDEHLSFNLRKKIFQSMTENNQSLYNPCDDLICLMKDEMEELRKQIGQKQTAIHNHGSMFTFLLPQAYAR